MEVDMNTLMVSLQQVAAPGEFAQKVMLTLLDKGVLALMALAAGYWISRKLEGYKTDQERILALERDKASLKNELEKQEQALRLQFREEQLSKFYWPIFFRFKKDSATWKLIPQLSGKQRALPDDIGRKIELSFLIKNHEEIVAIIENNVHLAQADENLLTEIVAYIRHVAVYRALREANDYTRNPIDLGEPFPEGLEQAIEMRLRTLQADHDRLLVPKS
jgi:hypothetical protein